MELKTSKKFIEPVTYVGEDKYLVHLILLQGLLIDTGRMTIND